MLPGPFHILWCGCKKGKRYKIYNKCLIGCIMVLKTVITSSILVDFQVMFFNEIICHLLQIFHREHCLIFGSDINDKKNDFGRFYL